MDWLLDVFALALRLKSNRDNVSGHYVHQRAGRFFIDVVYWVRRIKRKLSVYRRYPRMSYRELYKPDENR